MSNFDDFADLNAAIADQLQLKADAAAAKAARDRVKRGGTSGFGLQPDDLARIAAWEAAQEWKAVAAVALFEVESCLRCETESERFVQFMRLDRHRALRDSARVVRDDFPNPELPKRVYRQRRIVPMCPDCAESSGWLFDNVQEVDWADASPAALKGAN